MFVFGLLAELRVLWRGCLGDRRPRFSTAVSSFTSVPGCNSVLSGSQLQHQNTRDRRSGEGRRRALGGCAASANVQMRMEG